MYQVLCFNITPETGVWYEYRDYTLFRVYSFLPYGLILWSSTIIYLDTVIIDTTGRRKRHESMPSSHEISGSQDG